MKEKYHEYSIKANEGYQVLKHKSMVELDKAKVKYAP
jgi:hypothetical protein